MRNGGHVRFDAILPIDTLPQRLLVTLLTGCASIAVILLLAQVRPLRRLIS